MLINGVELKNLGIELYDRVLYSNEINTTQEWLDGDVQPTFIRQQDKFKTIKLEFLILATDEDEAFGRISRLTAMLKQATIKFDDLNFTFDTNLVEAGEPTRLKNGNFIVPYVLSSGYAKGQREIYTTNANMTNAFKLTVGYYKNSNILLDTDTITIRASMFDKPNITLEDLGININKYQPEYYNNGVVSNLLNLDLTYENLQRLQMLIINYSPVVYNITANYYLDSGNGIYNEMLERTVSFTQPQLVNYQTIGQLVDVQAYRPTGYKARVNYDRELTLENLLVSSPISIFYDKLEMERSKNVLIAYKIENDEGEFETIDSLYINVVETSLYDGSKLSDIISIDGHRPNPMYYNSGYIDGYASNELITYDDLEIAYSVIYTKSVNTLYVEYYAGTYPNWHRLTTTTLTTKYKATYDTEFNVLTDINIDLNKYHTAPYNDGNLYNATAYKTYDDVLNTGVLQVYYTPIDYPITVNYYTKDLNTEPIVETVNINALMFFGNPILSDIIPILEHRPEGYQLDEDFTYNGEISLDALTQASPIMIVYKEIEASRTKNIIIRYKQELSSAYSTIATNLITVSEADIVGGTRLRDFISLSAYRPEYYEDGVIDGASSSAVIYYDDIASEYTVLYMASSYATPVRYYLDNVEDGSWIGSSTISYRVIDFTTSTTLFDFGLSPNMYKPPYASDGEVLYTGPVNFTALMETESINVLYTTTAEPEDPDGVDYPHRFLFLEHNDLGEYEHLHPEWTMNHAYINTGISVDDMSKLTVVMECERVDNYVPLHQVNEGHAYLFGSYSPFGAFYMRYNNQTTYGEGLTGVNLFEAKAGAKSDVVSLTESSAIGFSNSSGIYASAQPNYSRVVFTYSHTLPVENVSMPYPLYLFANNYNGTYRDGIAGVGIYSCRIYYNDQLVRDFIPVQFYDKIGDKVAPSNCLYDKITQTFFEDGTGLNSFNIRDDDRYIDTNLQHKIGCCFVNYYKGDEFIKTSAIYFRGDDFVDKEFDLYEKFAVDDNTPQYCHPGEIENITSINPTFEGLNGGVFTVKYEPIESMITVNYYQEVEGQLYTIATEEIGLMEKDFYQVPTFGDLVRINKHKPIGFETDFKYTGAKVSLSRVVEGSPYNIIYRKMEEEPVEYTTTIRYIRKVFGVREYATVAEKVLTFDQSNFRDGEYIDFYIDKNEYKPERFYLDGQTYHWYEMDERLDTPEDLKPVYEIVYQPEKQFIDVNYYTDEVDEFNLVATTTWGISIDEMEEGYTYSVAELLPNSYINKFKPVNCNGGTIQDAEVAHTFESLIDLGYINVVYETLVEPDDPTEAYYEPKVLYFGEFKKKFPLGVGANKSETLYNGGIIPYIDLGYKPKEMGRLKVEVKAVAQSNGMLGNACSGGWQDTSYVDFFGYRVPRSTETLGLLSETKVEGEFTEDDLGNFYSSYVVNTLKGHFSCSTRVPESGMWVYTAEGPQSVDGQTLYTAGSAAGVIAGQPEWLYYGLDTTFRRGLAQIYDENWEVIECYKEYGTKEKRTIKDSWIVNPERFDPEIHAIANPITTVLDAYNSYWTSYTEEDSNHADYILFENNDEDIFEARLQPKGSLSLFRTTNPLTGKINIMPHGLTTRQTTSGGAGYVPHQLKGSNNPYTGNYKIMEYEVLVQVGTDSVGNAIFETKKQSKNIKYADFPLPVFPQLEACAIWSLKVWDRDRLIRDLIPVAKGDKIYDYIMPENGLFDLITEIFFGNSNEGGTYTLTSYFENTNKGEDGPQLMEATQTITIKPEDVLPLQVMYDPAIYGKITMNYYDYDYSFIGNKFITIPTWYSYNNTTFEEIAGYNDMKPDDFHLNGFLDIDDPDNPNDRHTLKEVYDMGSANVWYKLKTFTKTVVYYRGNYRVGSKDIFYSLQDIENAQSLSDLGINPDLYWTEDFAHGKIVFDESIISDSDIKAFIDAPSPIVVYDKLSKEEAPNLLYVEYYRGGASDDSLISPDPDNENYFDCNLDGVVLNPNGAIKYYNHYHSALYEDEDFDYFIPYQVKVLNKYIGIHSGPARKFTNLATIVDKPILTITEERNGWGRLKEYPVGWILLSATEPVVGPGQNPDYDKPDDETATIPFGTEIHISKLTVDRLWCYVPEVESWVKAEDISYNQSGKLYNALDVEVIHLDQIDFENVKVLSDLGIYPNKRILFFHERLDSDYEGELTYEALSNLHEMVFVYPETIYSYNCIYYKDHAQSWFEGHGSGKTKASTNVYQNTNASGTAIATIASGKDLILTGPKITLENGEEWYPILQKTNFATYVEGYMKASGINVIEEPSDNPVEKTSELGRASFSCSISDWNPDWEKFIETSWKIDENGVEISPTLYRDTELTLTWDYFGFEKNLFRPEGYPEGVYLWNPRSWVSDGDIRFSFYELVRCGTQRVVYPCIDPNIYKVWTYPNAVNVYYWSNGTEYAGNPGYPLILGSHTTSKIYYDNDESTGAIDVHYEFEMPGSDYANYASATAIGQSGVKVNSSQAVEFYGPGTIERGWGTSGTINTHIYYYNYFSQGAKYLTLPGGYDYSYAFNWSDFRDYGLFINGIRNSAEGQRWDFYIPYSNSQKEKITDTLNLKNYNLTRTGGSYSINSTSFGKWQWNQFSGVIHKVQSYENFEMIHYWTPVPKGLWYIFNGEERRIPDDGMFDILTGEFKGGYKMSDGSIGHVSGHSTTGSQPAMEPYADAINLIFLANSKVNYNKPFNYFDDWYYETTDIDYIAQINDNVADTFAQPDIYATKKRRLENGLVLPISKVSADENNRVVGEWYYSSDQWFETKHSNIHVGDFDKSKLVKHSQSIALVAPADKKKYYVYLDPSQVAVPGETSNFTYSNTGQVIAVYYNYTDINNNKYYFDGAKWIPEYYTAFNTVEHNKNYVIIPNNINYYSQPIENDSFIEGQYHYGERITILYTSEQDPEWGFTGLGWIRVNNKNLSEIL